MALRITSAHKTVSTKTIQVKQATSWQSRGRMTKETTRKQQKEEYTKT